MSPDTQHAQGPASPLLTGEGCLSLSVSAHRRQSVRLSARLWHSWSQVSEPLLPPPSLPLPAAPGLPGESVPHVPEPSEVWFEDSEARPRELHPEATTAPAALASPHLVSLAPSFPASPSWNNKDPVVLSGPFLPRLCPPRAGES